MNIAIYARYSSHNQNEQSIEGQLNACYEYAKRNGYIIVGEYIDRALSGTTDNRPEFQRMIEDSGKKHFQFVLVYQLDRFARNRYDSAIYKARLKKNDVRVLSARENISADASGILVEGLLESMAEYYSAELSQKILRGMDLNAEKCLSTGGNVALGFCVDSDKRFQIDPQTAPIIQKIFEMYAQDYTMAEIIRYMNSLHIQTSRSNEFNKNSIRRILTNKRYIGVYTYREKEYKDGIPRIISDALFEEVQRKIGKNKLAPARSKAKVEYILTTKLFCGCCGGMMTGMSGAGKSGKVYNYYICNNAKKKTCHKKPISKDRLENLVIEETKCILTDNNIDLIAKEVVKICQTESNSSTIQRLERLLKENAKATTNLIKALETGQAADIIAEQLVKRQAERKELERQTAEEKAQYPMLTIPQVKFFMERFRNGDINDLKYRKALVDTFVRKIVLYDDKLTILYNAQDGQSALNLDDECSSNGTLVEARGIEPLSEIPTTCFSPSASGGLTFPPVSSTPARSYFQ